MKFDSATLAQANERSVRHLVNPVTDWAEQVGVTLLFIQDESSCWPRRGNSLEEVQRFWGRPSHFLSDDCETG